MIAITYIGHATNFIEWDGQTIFTDPHFSPRTFFLKRHSPFTCDLGQLHQPECVLLSHTHFDHLDIRSYKYLSCHVPIVVPKKIAPLIHHTLANPVIELPEGASWISPHGFKITATKARHRGGRYSGVRYTSSNSYLIEKNDKAVYFAGDTAYHDDFKKLGQDKNIHVALLPIGAYKPRWFMKYHHMNPEEALKAFQDLQAQYMIPIHWGTFRLSTESLDEPIKNLKKLLTQHPDPYNVKIIPHGMRFTFDEAPLAQKEEHPKPHLTVA